MKIKTNHIKLVAFRAVLVLVCVSLVACAVRNNSYAADNDNYDSVFEDGKPIYIKNDGSMIPDIYNTGYDPNIAIAADIILFAFSLVVPMIKKKL